jgi:hypothetical protein
MVISNRLLWRVRQLGVPARARRWGAKLLRSVGERTASDRVLPHFLIIGQRRCGTTSLYEYLAGHPHVIPALTKEVFYFDYNYPRGEDWYRGHFPTEREIERAADRLGGPCRTGEATPSYFMHPEAPGRIYACSPEAKLILLLRNSTAHAASAYYFGVRQGTYTERENPIDSGFRSQIRYLKSMSDDELLLPEARTRASVILSGIYLPFLKRWHAVFPREQLLTIRSEELDEHTESTYRKVLRFLDLPEEIPPHFHRANANQYPPLAPSLRELLDDFYRPHNERLSEYLQAESGSGFAPAQREAVGSRG